MRALARLTIGIPTEQFAICIARYCAVFPISKGINIFFKARGNRSDELPHSYQMMLFWAGLRGAVGVALAEGMKGENAVALRTTVLVSVVLTVVVFGGTIGRMIEILGIRTGVEEDDGESSDEEGGGGSGGGYQLAGMEDGHGVGATGIRGSKRRSYPLGVSIGSNGGGGNKFDDEPVVSTGDSPYRDRIHSMPGSTTRLGTLHPVSSFRAHSAPTSDHSNSSEDSDPDVLPGANTSLADASSGSLAGGDKEGDLTRVWRDGQWFTVLDERYLLPVFSNATASRRQATKKAQLRAKRHSFAVDGRGLPGGSGNGGGGGEDSFEEGTGSAEGSPYLGGGNRKEFNGSFSVGFFLFFRSYL